MTKPTPEPESLGDSRRPLLAAAGRPAADEEEPASGPRGRALALQSPRRSGQAVDADLVEYARGGDRRVRDRLLARYAGLVAAVARRVVAGLPPHVEYADLVSSGTLGLFEALDRFDPRAGKPFEAFAFPRIRGAMLDHVRKVDGLPRYAAQGVGQDGERSRARLVEFDELLADPSMAGVLADTAWYADPALVAEDSDARAWLRWAIDRLPDRSRRVVEWHYRDGMTFTRIGQMLGVGESRAVQLHAHALALLRARLRPP
ncbi:MAG: sigma-70 family RNA polymerase sigma factor [Streptosporangiales bacterium]